MRILAIADRPPKEGIAKTIEEKSVDVICTLGDLDMFELNELGGVREIPKLGVYGNHCSGNYFGNLGIQNVHLKTVEIGGVTFGGFQGSVRYKEGTAIMYTQKEATEMLRDFPRVDIMLAHCPPYGINDDTSEITHTGFIALRQYLDRAQPAHLLHGHTYPRENELVVSYGETRIHYVFGGKLIDV